jgi:GNAT superfamily N-acetyltransferase
MIRSETIIKGIEILAEEIQRLHYSIYLHRPLCHILRKRGSSKEEFVRLFKGEYALLTDLRPEHIKTIHRYLSQESYWAQERSHETVLRSVENSLCFAIERDNALAGFARAISDRATFAYIADVFVLPEHRGQGLGKWLIEYIVEHSELSHLGWLLATADAHELYRKYGFESAQGSTRYMSRSPRPR